MDYFSNDPQADKIDAVRNEVEKTKKIMVQSIDKVLERGERIELLVDRTDQLSQQSIKFNKLGKNLKYAMCRKNVKLIIIIIIVSIIALWLILSFACGFDFHKCGAGGGSEHSAAVPIHPTFALICSILIFIL